MQMRLMAHPIVYGPAASTCVWSARLTLAEKGVTHELVDVPFADGRPWPARQGGLARRARGGRMLAGKAAAEVVRRARVRSGPRDAPVASRSC